MEKYIFDNFPSAVNISCGLEKWPICVRHNDCYNKEFGLTTQITYSNHLWDENLKLLILYTYFMFLTYENVAES